MSVYVRQARFPAPKTAALPSAPRTKDRRSSKGNQGPKPSNNRNLAAKSRKSGRLKVHSQKPSSSSYSSNRSSQGLVLLPPPERTAFTERAPTEQSLPAPLGPTMTIHNDQGLDFHDLSQLTESQGSKDPTVAHKAYQTAREPFAGSVFPFAAPAPAAQQRSGLHVNGASSLRRLQTYLSTHGHPPNETMPSTYLLGQQSLPSSKSVSSQQERSHVPSSSSFSLSSLSNHPNNASLANNSQTLMASAASAASFNKLGGQLAPSEMPKNPPGVLYGFKNKLMTPARYEQEARKREAARVSTVPHSRSNFRVPLPPVPRPIGSKTKILPAPNQRHGGASNSDQSSTKPKSDSRAVGCADKEATYPSGHRSPGYPVGQDASQSSTDESRTVAQASLFTRDLEASKKKFDEKIKTLRGELDSSIDKVRSNIDSKEKQVTERIKLAENSICEFKAKVEGEVEAHLSRLAEKVQEHEAILLAKAQEPKENFVEKAGRSVMTEIKVAMTELETRKAECTAKESEFLRKVQEIDAKQRADHDKWTSEIEAKSRDAMDSVSKVGDQFREVADSYLSKIKSVADSFFSAGQRFLSGQSKDTEHGERPEAENFVSPNPVVSSTHLSETTTLDDEVAGAQGEVADCTKFSVKTGHKRTIVGTVPLKVGEGGLQEQPPKKKLTPASKEKMDTRSAKKPKVSPFTPLDPAGFSLGKNRTRAGQEKFSQSSKKKNKSFVTPCNKSFASAAPLSTKKQQAAGKPLAFTTVGKKAQPKKPRTRAARVGETRSRVTRSGNLQDFSFYFS